MTDKIFISALKKIEDKYKRGMAERDGLGMEHSDLPLKDWLLMLQEEHIDAVFYIEKTLDEMEKQ